MRPVLTLSLLLAGCAVPMQPPEVHMVTGNPTELAACTWRSLREDRNVQLTPLPGGAEVSYVLTVCGLAGCAPPIAMWSADFDPAGSGQTRITYRYRPTLIG